MRPAFEAVLSRDQPFGHLSVLDACLFEDRADGLVAELFVERDDGHLRMEQQLIGAQGACMGLERLHQAATDAPATVLTRHGHSFRFGALVFCGRKRGRGREGTKPSGPDRNPAGSRIRAPGQEMIRFVVEAVEFEREVDALLLDEDASANDPAVFESGVPRGESHDGNRAFQNGFAQDGLGLRARMLALIQCYARSLRRAAAARKHASASPPAPMREPNPGSGTGKGPQFRKYVAPVPGT